ncbi:hypothetical protein [Micromonospora sp. CB01531]|uniref:hypothetical protein n=1 Tax=Micromonospora sp. CB01531 TaxID=1718947 RepID=UPI000A57595A|nr:hypothetical protein [Micromonospora sp. CB01531]
MTTVRDRLTHLLHRDQQPEQPDEIEQWIADLGREPAAGLETDTTDTTQGAEQ